MSTFKIQLPSNGSFLGIQKNGELCFGEMSMTFRFIYPTNTKYVCIEAIETNPIKCIYYHELNLSLKPYSNSESNKFYFVPFVTENKLRLMTSNNKWVNIYSNYVGYNKLFVHSLDLTYFNIVFTPTETKKTLINGRSPITPSTPTRRRMTNENNPIVELGDVVKRATDFFQDKLKEECTKAYKKGCEDMRREMINRMNDIVISYGDAS